MLDAQRPIDTPRFLIEALNIARSRKIGLIAVTIHLANPPTIPPGLSASDVVAICSLVVALLALGLSIAAAETQRRHNILLARPHMDVDLGVEHNLLSVTNHGPGTARLRSLTGTVDNLTFNFLLEADLEEFCQWLADGLQDDITLRRALLHVGSSFAPNHTIEIIGRSGDMNDDDRELLLMMLKKIAIDVSYACIFDKVYSEHIESVQRNTP